MNQCAIMNLSKQQSKPKQKGKVQIMRVENLYSSNGNKVANQFRIEANWLTTFQSYNSEIITIDRLTKVIKVGADYNYSTTTSKYRNSFLREEGFSGLADIKSLNKAIKDGKYEDYRVEMMD